MKTKIDLFSGFLGAGKTMLIKKLISEKLYDENIVIIENEFGEIGIDGSILKRTNIEVKEINAGCICCSISGDFKQSIEEVINKYKPQRIIIEPSGVGKLSEVLNVCRSSGLKDKITLNMIITVVDVMKFDMYISNFAEFYSNQIINAKTIILSRSQKVENEKIEKVVEGIKKLNSKADIITTAWDNLKGERIIDVAEESIKQSLDEQINLLKKPTGKISAKMQTEIIKNHNANEVFTTWAVETPKKFCEKNLHTTLERLNNQERFGIVLRAKGIVQAEENHWVQFDYVPGEMQIVKTTPDYTGRLCIIGNNLNKENLKKLFS